MDKKRKFETRRKVSLKWKHISRVLVLLSVLWTIAVGKLCAQEVAVNETGRGRPFVCRQKPRRTAFSMTSSAVVFVFSYIASVIIRGAAYTISALLTTRDVLGVTRTFVSGNVILLFILFGLVG